MEEVLMSYAVCISLIVLINIQITGSIQCYSCKATSSNELNANIQCLEKAYLENCDEFYQYYNEVEDPEFSDYPEYDDYYYYDDVVPQTNDVIGKTTGSSNNKGAATSKARQTRELKRNSSQTKKKKNEYEDDDDKDEREVEEDGDDDNRQKKDARDNGVKSKNDKKDDYNDDEYYEYEYYEVDENEEDDRDTDDEDDTFSVKPKTPEKNEHYCYSLTQKSSWESYTVEKGCKKITYCKAALEKKPEWGNPWNFCCDRSRCNVKLVKDKPQRVYGMGCRRTDDCIQGHNGRPVCPAYFKSCPRISHGLVKMECRSQAYSMAAVKNTAKYRQLYRDKKCYCSKGYYPKGPICTSSPASLFITPSVLQFAIMTATTYVLN